MSSSIPNSSKLEQPSTSAASVIVQALRETLGHADDNAVLRITRDCRDKAPDATNEEIAYFIRQQGNRVARMKEISNPMGFIIKQVPLCFEGESLRQHREMVRSLSKAEEGDDRVRAETILADRYADPEEVNWVLDRYPRLRGYTPPPEHRRAVDLRHVKRALYEIQREGCPPAIKQEQRRRLEELQQIWPGIVAEVKGASAQANDILLNPPTP
jgi:hypothetical protein